MKNNKYELVICIVNAGFSGVVMDAAREVGCGGGTILNARGTADKTAEEFFHITIQPEKEMVMLLVETKIKDDVLTEIYRRAGLKSEGAGIAFSVPVDKVVGLSDGKPKSKSGDVKKNEDKVADKTTEAPRFNDNKSDN